MLDVLNMKLLMYDDKNPSLDPVWRALEMRRTSNSYPRLNTKFLSVPASEKRPRTQNFLDLLSMEAN